MGKSLISKLYNVPQEHHLMTSGCMAKMKTQGKAAIELAH